MRIRWPGIKYALCLTFRDQQHTKQYAVELNASSSSSKHPLGSFVLYTKLFFSRTIYWRILQCDCMQSSHCESTKMSERTIECLLHIMSFVPGILYHMLLGYGTHGIHGTAIQIIMKLSIYSITIDFYVVVDLNRNQDNNLSNIGWHNIDLTGLIDRNMEIGQWMEKG